VIIGPDFVIGHIGKTGGDAAKQYTEALRPKGVHWYAITNPDKHLPPHQVVDLEAHDLVLTFRRLPSMVLSWFHHFGWQRTRFDSKSEMVAAMVEFTRPDEVLKEFVSESKRIPYFIRCENLFDDLIEFYQAKGVLVQTLQAARLFEGIETKPKRQYQHRISSWFSSGQLKQLYQNNPLWSEYENRVYGYLVR